MGWRAQSCQLGYSDCKRYAKFRFPLNNNYIISPNLLRALVFGMWTLYQDNIFADEKIGYGLGVHHHRLRGGLWALWALGAILLHCCMLGCPVRLYEPHRYASTDFVFTDTHSYLSLSEPSRWGTAMALYMVSLSSIKSLVVFDVSSRLALFPTELRWYFMPPYFRVLPETQSKFNIRVYARLCPILT
jgi:hypothetical protein